MWISRIIQRDFWKFWLFPSFLLQKPSFFDKNHKKWRFLQQKRVKSQNFQKSLCNSLEIHMKYLWSKFEVKRSFAAPENVFGVFWDILDFVKIREFPYILANFRPKNGWKMLTRHFLANFWLKSVVTQWVTYENTKKLYKMWKMGQK